MAYKYKLVVAGGTFDHLHKGHKGFLRFVFSCAEKVLLGITSDTYAQQKASGGLESYEVRKKNLEEFLKQEGVSSRVTIAPIDSAFYPKDWEEAPIEAIVATQETKKGAESINADRLKKHLPILDIVIAPFITTDTHEILSSSHIRKGRVSPEGKSYFDNAWLSHDLILPADKRDQFRKPFGRLVSFGSIDFSLFPHVATVGDVTSKLFNQHGVLQKISLVDMKVQRKEIFHNLSDLGFSGDELILSAKNAPGTLSAGALQKILDAMQMLENPKRIVIQIEGEEDLLVLPLVLTLPLGFQIFYGQPNEGLVHIDVSLQAKDKAYSLMQLFPASH